MRSSFAIVFAITLLFKYAFAESIQEMVWVVPDGGADDLSSDFTQGTTLEVQWNGWDETDFINPYEDLVDLWCTTWELSATAANNYLLQQNLNLTTDGSYNWPIKISNDDLSLTAKWVLRFKAHASDQKYDASTENLSSPGFIVLVAASQSTSAQASSTTTSDKSSSTSDSSSSDPPSKTTDSDNSKTTATASTGTETSNSATTTGISTTNPTGTAALASSTSTSTLAAISKSTSGGLSSGAKAGVGIACAVGALALIGTMVAFFVKKRHQRNSASPPDYSTGGFGAAEAALARELKPQPQVATYPYKRETAYEPISETKPYLTAQPQTYQPPQAQDYQPPQVQAYNPPQALQAYPTGSSQTPYSVLPAQTYSSAQPSPAQTYSELHTIAPTSPLPTGNGGSFPIELSNNEIGGPVELPGHVR